MEKVRSLPPADSHFQISLKVKFQIEAFFLQFSARLLDSFSMSGVLFVWDIVPILSTQISDNHVSVDCKQRY